MEESSELIIESLKTYTAEEKKTKEEIIEF